MRRFSQAGALLEHLLDLHERQPDRRRTPIAHPDYEKMPTHAAVEAFEAALAAAERSGAVRIERERAALARHEIARVRLLEAGRLYRHLGREPAAALATRAATGLEALVAGRPAAVAAIPEELRQGWARRESPYGLAPGDSEGAAIFLRLLCGFLDGLHEDVDQRTFCRRAAGDSKALERPGQAARVARVLSRLHGLEPAEPSAVLELLGIRKYPAPVCLRGPVAIDLSAGRLDLSTLRPYAALAPDHAAQLRPAAAPAYLLSIENFASFNRHAREIADDGLLLYTGGFPSRAVQAALAALDRTLPPQVPFFHWGDIDPWGLKIFRALEQQLRHPLRPHLMDPAIAARGAPAAPAGADMRRLAESGSAVAALAAALASETARHLEQEELDPQSPA